MGVRRELKAIPIELRLIFSLAPLLDKAPLVPWEFVGRKRRGFAEL